MKLNEFIKRLQEYLNKGYSNYDVILVDEIGNQIEPNIVELIEVKPNKQLILDLVDDEGDEDEELLQN